MPPAASQLSSRWFSAMLAPPFFARASGGTAITDRATYADPTRPSQGVRQLYVHGVPVVHAGEIVTDAYPGRAVRSNP